jgi:hypothetical protein
VGAEAEETTSAAAGADYQDVTEAVTEAAPEAEKGADYQGRVAVELPLNKFAKIIQHLRSSQIYIREIMKSF